MSEYWKSTPNYWCKHCKTYVRDTPLEKTNHEATPRHQGNLKRFLRDLHRENDRSEREKFRAKDEVARLNGAAPISAPRDGSGQFKSTVTFKKTTSRTATADERKRQMAQLAEMGVTVPEEFRRENAMAGEWQVVNQRAILPKEPEVKNEEDIDVKLGLNVGVRKRKVEEDVEEEVTKLEQGRRRPRYGRDIKKLPGDDDDLDALLESTTTFTKRLKGDPKVEEKTEDNIQPSEAPSQEHETNSLAAIDEQDNSSAPNVKAEDTIGSDSVQDSFHDLDAKQNAEDENIGSIFKKRKPKAVRQQ